MSGSDFFDSDRSLSDPEESFTEGEVRAAIYARTSSVNQRFGHSLDEQVRRCRKRCEMKGWTPVYIFRDEAESGGDTDRPMFQSMMERAQQRLYDVIVVWKLDRFSRSLMHAVQLEERLRETGVGLHSVTEQIDTTTPAGRFNFRNIASAAEFEREMIQQRTEMGMEGFAQDHKWPNEQPPLGYVKTNDDRLDICDSEAKLVREIFRRYIDRKSMPTVAEELNNEGHYTKTGGQWSPRAVGDILRNELYTGTYDVAGVTDHVEEYQILDQSTFETATEIRHRFRTKDSPRESMPQNRKERLVDGIVADYEAFLNTG